MDLFHHDVLNGNMDGRLLPMANNTKMKSMIIGAGHNVLMQFGNSFYAVC